MNRFKTRLIASLCGLTIIFSACTGEKTETQKTKVEKKPLVRIEQVRAVDVNQTREFTATVKANISNNIAPNMPVRIDKIMVEVGDLVKKGQKLVQMENTNLENAKTQLDNIRTEFQRIDELYKIGGTSKSSWDAMKMNLQVTETTYNNLVENTQLSSPIDGIVTARNYDKGDMYSGLPILVVEQISPVKLKINVSESYFTKVKKGMPVEIKFDVYGNEVFTGEVTLVYPTIDANTRTFPVELQIKNTDNRVRPGMFARVTINFGSLNHIVVPDRAVVKQAGSGERYIYTLNNDNTVTMKKVELGRLIDASYEITSGLNDGDKVVIAGQSNLMNGIEVEVEK